MCVYVCAHRATQEAELGPSPALGQRHGGSPGCHPCVRLHRGVNTALHSPAALLQPGVEVEQTQTVIYGCWTRSPNLAEAPVFKLQFM